MRWLFALLPLIVVLTDTPALAAGAPSDTTRLPTFTMRYDVSWSGIGIGTIDLSLKPWAGRPDCYRYSAATHPTMLFRLVYGTLNQSSEFCTSEDRLRPQHFKSSLPGDDKQTYALDFDWNAHTVTDDHGRVRHIPDDAVDSLSLQQAVRLWVLSHADSIDADAATRTADFTMVDDHNQTPYRFRFAGHKTVGVPAGHFDTLLMERIDTPGKVGRFWLAPSRGYMPVKSETRNGRSPAVVMELSR